jgi:hypothetical protein
MAGQDWSITIVPSGSSAAFQPQNGSPGQPQRAENADLISWNNRTGETHQPWPATEDYEPLPDSQVQKGTAVYLSDEIEAWSSSSPAYLCTAPPMGVTTIYYVCKFHPEEQGQIKVSAT